MDWLILTAAGIFEIVWALGLKYSQGFTKGFASFVTLGAAGISFWLLSIAVKTIPLGTAYTVWTGIGILGTVLFGIFFFQESFHLTRLLFILFVIVGIVGLRVVS